MRFVGGIVCLSLAVGVASAASQCVPATLDQYIRLGSTGCTIGAAPNFTFSDFSFSSEATSGEPQQLRANQILVTPGVGPGGLSLILTFSPTASSPGFQVATGQGVNYGIHYLADPPPPEIIRFTSDLFDDPAFGPASTDIDTSLCVDANCARTLGLSVFDNPSSATSPGTGQRLNDAMQISPSTVVLDVTNSITLDASDGGSASFGSFDNVIGLTDVATPEPGTVALMLTGLLGLGARRVLTKFR